MVKFNVKKFCANCVMFAGAVTALTGAAKSVIDLVPKGCVSQKAEVTSAYNPNSKYARLPAPPPPPRDIRTNLPTEKIGRGPAAPAKEEPDYLWWSFGPAMLILGFFVALLGREMKLSELGRGVKGE